MSEITVVVFTQLRRAQGDVTMDHAFAHANIGLSIHAVARAVGTVF
jgi:hypothetical protein